MSIDSMFPWTTLLSVWRPPSSVRVLWCVSEFPVGELFVILRVFFCGCDYVCLPLWLFIWASNCFSVYGFYLVMLTYFQSSSYSGRGMGFSLGWKFRVYRGRGLKSWVGGQGSVLGIWQSSRVQPDDDYMILTDIFLIFFLQKFLAMSVFFKKLILFIWI